MTREYFSLKPICLSNVVDPKMNVVIAPGEYKSSQVYFTEAKPNIHIPNSTFNRITYSTTDFIMNGLYLQFELFIRQNEQNYNSNIYNCHFDPNHEHNQFMLSIFHTIESSILDKWIRIRHSSSSSSSSSCSNRPIPTPSGDIIQQLRTGVISVWKNDMRHYDKPQFQHFIIKISGVWENESGCGLTYKFF